MRLKGVYLGLVVIVGILAISLILMSSVDLDSRNSVYSGYSVTANVVASNPVFSQPVDIFRDDFVFMNITQEANALNDNKLFFEVSQPGRVVWKYAYVVNEDSGNVMNVTALTSNPLDSDWVLGDAKFNFDLNDSFEGNNFLLTYSCVLVNNSWMCGCDSESCSDHGWTKLDYTFEFVSLGGDVCSALESGETSCLQGNLRMCLGDFDNDFYKWFVVQHCDSGCTDDDLGNAACNDLLISDSSCSQNSFCEGETIFECDANQAFPIDFLATKTCNSYTANDVDEKLYDQKADSGAVMCVGNSLFLSEEDSSGVYWKHVSYCQNGCEDGECLNSDCVDLDDCDSNSLYDKKCADDGYNLQTCMINELGCYEWISEPCVQGCDTSGVDHCYGGTCADDESAIAKTIYSGSAWVDKDVSAGACCSKETDCVDDNQDCVDEYTVDEDLICEGNAWYTCELSNNCTAFNQNYCYYNETQIAWLWADFKPVQCNCQSDSGCSSTTEGYQQCSSDTIETCTADTNQECYYWIPEATSCDADYNCVEDTSDNTASCECIAGTINSTTNEICDSGSWITCDSSNECQEVQGKYCDSGSWVDADNTVCDGCYSRDECPTGQVCLSEGGQCVDEIITVSGENILIIPLSDYLSIKGTACLHTNDYTGKIPEVYFRTFDSSSATTPICEWQASDNYYGNCRTSQCMVVSNDPYSIVDTFTFKVKRGNEIFVELTKSYSSN